MTGTAFVSEQFDETYPPGVEHYFWTFARNRIVLREIHAAAAEMGKPRHLLEIGCGRGVVLKFLRDHGIACAGVEPSPAVLPGDLAPYVRIGVDCFQVPACERASYDGLLLLDVLEHIADPVGFLREVRAAYANARFLILTVPARAELWSNYDDHFGHFRRYTVEALTTELRSAGFAGVRARYLFRALYPVMLGINWLRGHRFTALRAPRNVALHRFMAQCFAVEDRVLPGWVPGTSVIARAWGSAGL